jgi:hypothetical protein
VNIWKIFSKCTQTICKLQCKTTFIQHAFTSIRNCCKKLENFVLNFMSSFIHTMVKNVCLVGQSTGLTTTMLSGILLVLPPQCHLAVYWSYHKHGSWWSICLPRNMTAGSQLLLPQTRKMVVYWSYHKHDSWYSILVLPQTWQFGSWYATGLTTNTAAGKPDYSLVVLPQTWQQVVYWSYHKLDSW